MKLCPVCGSIASLNTYFGAYICEKCNWKDDAFSKVRTHISEKENIWFLLEKFELEKSE